jgi:hypothetical protein
MKRREFIGIGAIAAGEILLSNTAQSREFSVLEKELRTLGMNGMIVLSLTGKFVVQGNHGKFIESTSLVSTMNQAQVKLINGKKTVWANLPNTTGEFGMLRVNLGSVENVLNQLKNQDSSVLASYIFADGTNNRFMYDHKLLNGYLVLVRMMRYGTQHPIVSNEQFSYLNDFNIDIAVSAGLLGWGLQGNGKGGKDRVRVQSGGICLTGSLLFKLAKQLEYFQKRAGLEFVTSSGQEHGGNWNYFSNHTDPTRAGLFDATVYLDGKNSIGKLVGKDLVINFPKLTTPLFLHTNITLDPSNSKDLPRNYDPMIHCTADLLVQTSFRTYPMKLKEMELSLLKLFEFFDKRNGLSVPEKYMSYLESEYTLAKNGG